MRGWCINRTWLRVFRKSLAPIRWSTQAHNQTSRSANLSIFLGRHPRDLETEIEKALFSDSAAMSPRGDLHRLAAATNFPGLREVRKGAIEVLPAPNRAWPFGPGLLRFHRCLMTVKSTRQRLGLGPTNKIHATACRPFLATRVSSLRDAPRGCFSPRSHWLTRPVVTLR